MKPLYHRVHWRDCPEFCADNAFSRQIGTWSTIELDALCEQSRLAKGVDGKNRTQQWRVKATVRGKRTRLELIVSTEPRPEGPLPQLIAVRNKGA